MLVLILLPIKNNNFLPIYLSFFLSPFGRIPKQNIFAVVVWKKQFYNDA